MNDFIMPNIPDDDISPGNIDFKWLGIMLGIIIGISIFSYVLFYGFAKLFISKMDLSDEKKYFGNFFIENTDEKYDFSNISYQVNIPQNIDVYIKESKEINAFASLGGNVIFTTELLKNIKYQEEFLFILGHEIEHIESRDPIRVFSVQFPFYIVISFFGFDPSLNYDKIIEISANYMSRKTELKADNGGIKYLKNIGGNPFCATSFFEDKDNIFNKYLNINSTHPDNIERIENIKKNSTDINFDKCKKFSY